MKKSEFTGKLLGLIGTNLLAMLITIITLGICIPWAICIQQRWYAKHTILNGHQLVFVGEGGQLFGQFIKWFLLTIITIGIYGFWVKIKMHAWVVSKTEFAK